MNLPAPYWQSDCGRFTIYCADCLALLPHLTGVDAVVTDPPYGIGYQSRLVSLGATVRDAIVGDDCEMDLRGILTMPCPVLCFGASNFPAQLPHRGRWLCWDKRTIDGACDAMLGSPMELAWANKKTGYNKMVRCLHGGVINADGGKRVHPTQKPAQVMIEAIEWAARDCATILDPFMGSGTTGVACVRMGRQFIGIEIVEKYCAIARDRIKRELAQGDFIRDAAVKQSAQKELI